MDSFNQNSSPDSTRASKRSGHGARALASAINELIEHGVIPARKRTDYLGQASMYLKQAFQAVTILRESTKAINDTTNRTKTPWDWFPLHKDEEIRAGVVGINPYRPIPIHDHPGASGILLVLEGHIIERSYQIDSTQEKATGLVELIPGQKRYLDAGQWSVFMPDWNNLHSLSAMSRPAMAFSIQFHPYDERVRNWFLMTDSETDGSIKAVRTHQDMLTHQPV